MFVLALANCAVGQDSSQGSATNFRAFRDSRREARQRAIDSFGEEASSAQSASIRGADLGLGFQSGTAGNGLVIANVNEGSAFARAGFRPSDQIVSLNGQPITTEAQFLGSLFQPNATQQEIVVARNGQQQRLSIQASAIQQGMVVAAPFYRAGLVLDGRNPNQMVVQRVFPRSAAFNAGLRTGDVITNVNGQNISSFSSLLQALQNANGSNVGLQVSRNGQPQTLQMNAGSPASLNQAAQNNSVSAANGNSATTQSPTTLSSTATTDGAVAPQGSILTNPTGASGSSLPETVPLQRHWWHRKGQSWRARMASPILE